MGFAKIARRIKLKLTKDFDDLKGYHEIDGKLIHGYRPTSEANLKYHASHNRAVHRHVLAHDDDKKTEILEDEAFNTFGAACWDPSGQHHHSLSAGRLLARGLVSKDTKLVKVARGFHISSFGTVELSAVSPGSQIGDNYGQSEQQPTRLSTVKDLVADPVTAAAVVELNWSPFADASATAAINSIDWSAMIDWSNLALPEFLAHAASAISSAGWTVGEILHLAATGAHGVPFLAPALRLYAYYTQEMDPTHNAYRTWDRSKSHIAPVLPLSPPDEIVKLAALRAYSNLNGGLMNRSAIDPALFNARQALRAFSEDDAGQRAMLSIATSQAQEIANGNGKTVLGLPNDVGEITAGLIQRRFPEFAVQMRSTRHSHGTLQVIRHAFMTLAYSLALAENKDKGVRMVGATPAQVTRFGNVVHADSPVLSGRDDYRHNVKASEADKQHVASHWCDSKFEDCEHAFPGALVVAPFSVMDTHVETFLAAMIRRGHRTAYVMTHIPVPFLDKRVTTYRDDWTGCLYETHGDKIRMYHTTGAAAGYVNDRDNMMSWCSPLPYFKGFHVQVEERRRFGTVFLLEVTIGEGKQELTPTMWRVTDEQFYTLPLTVPKYREQYTKFFVVPANRFMNVVAFAMAPGGKNTSKDREAVSRLLTNKIRGQQAEIKIGGNVVEPRWELSIDEFNAIRMHAIVAAKWRETDLEYGLADWTAYMSRNEMRWGLLGMPGRIINYFCDLFSGNLTGESDPTRLSFGRRLLDALFGRRFDRTQAWDFYTPAGEYRVINELTNDRVPNFFKDWSDLANWASVTSRKGMEWLNSTLTLTGDYIGTMEDRCNPIIAARERDMWDLLSDPKAKLKARCKPAVKTPALVVAPAEPVDPANVPLPDSDIEEDLALGVVQTPAIVNADAVVEEVQPGPRVQVGEGENETVQTTPTVVVDVAEAFLSDSESDVESVPEPAVDRRPPPKPSIAPFFASDPLGAETEQPVLDLDGADVKFFTHSKFRPEDAMVRIKPESKCSEAFWESFGLKYAQKLTKRFSSHEVVPAPDVGLISIVESRMQSEMQSCSFDGVMTDHLLASAKILDTSSELAMAICKFFEQLKPEDLHRVRVPSVILNGVAASAKSSVIRQYLRRRHRGSALVVTPSRRLAKEWRDAGSHYTTVTQHAIWRKCTVLVLDEFYALDFVVAMSWLALALKHGVPVIALGEQNQRYQGASATPLDIISEMPTLELLLGVSNCMPLDVCLLAEKYLGDVGPFRYLQTRSKVVRSIYLGAPSRVMSSLGNLEAGLLFRARSTDTMPVGKVDFENVLSISQVQGLRAEEAVLALPLMQSVTSWLNLNKNQVYVAFSRHSKRLIITQPAHIAVKWMGTAFESVAPCHGNYGKKPSAEPAFMLDSLEFDSEPVDADLLQLKDSNVIESRIETVNPIDDSWTPDLEIPLDASPIELEQFVAERTQHDHIFDHAHALDMLIPKAGSLHSIGSDFSIKFESKPRAYIDGAEKIAVQQRGDNSFDDIRNVALRQTSTKPIIEPRSVTLSQVKYLVRRFKYSYFADEYSTFPMYSASDSWLNSRSTAYLVKLANSLDQHLEAGASTRHQAFLKTQDKVKAEMGFSASWTHGQTVIASETSYNAFFGPMAKRFADRLKDRLRSDAIIDVGFSDRELGRKLRETGLSSAFVDANVQIDISRQDSSHTLVSLLVFAALLLDCGMDADAVSFYVERRCLFSFKSMSPGLYQGLLRFNLPSGDPFTLLCNIVQAMTATCERYNVRNRGCLHKGDDEVYTGSSLETRYGEPIESLRAVEFKEVYGAPPYHAGRFILPDDVIADPVRRVYKVLARSENPNISNAELHVAVLDWHFKATEFNCRYLTRAIPMIYQDLTTGDADLMIRTAYKLRDRKFLDAIYRDSSVPDFVRGLKILDPDNDCARQVARFLLPEAEEDFLELFVNRTSDELVVMFRRHTKMPVFRHYGKADKRKVTRGVQVEDDHVFLVY